LAGVSAKKSPSLVCSEYIGESKDLIGGIKDLVEVMKRKEKEKEIMELGVQIEKVKMIEKAEKEVETESMDKEENEEEENNEENKEGDRDKEEKTDRDGEKDN
jgi:hypothetical protein